MHLLIMSLILCQWAISDCCKCCTFKVVSNEWTQGKYNRITAQTICSKIFWTIDLKFWTWSIFYLCTSLHDNNWIKILTISDDMIYIKNHENLNKALSIFTPFCTIYQKNFDVQISGNIWAWFFFLPRLKSELLRLSDLKSL